MSILIAVPTFNRLAVTQLCLAQLMCHKRADDQVYVCDDHSTDFTTDALKKYADTIVTLPNKSTYGPDTIRWHQMEHYLSSSHEFMYCTDSDAYHDPDFINTLLNIYTKIGNSKLPVSLFNSYYHNSEGNIVLKKGPITLKRTAPGISMFFNKPMVEKILKGVHDAPAQHRGMDWDFRACGYLEQFFITSNNSHLEHFGFGGLHYSEQNNDIALNPTPFIEQRRQPIIEYLQKGTALPPGLW